MYLLTKMNKLTLLMAMLLVSNACSNAIPKTKLIFNPKPDTTSSSKNSIAVAGGNAFNGTYNISYSVNMVNGPMPASNGVSNLRAADAQVLHHAHP